MQNMQQQADYNVVSAEYFSKVSVPGSVPFAAPSDIASFKAIAISPFDVQQSSAKDLEGRLDAAYGSSHSNDAISPDSMKSLSALHITTQTRQAQSTTPTPQLDLVSLPTDFAPLSPLDNHTEHETNTGEPCDSSFNASKPIVPNVADSVDVLSSSGGFRPSFMQQNLAAKQADANGNLERRVSNAIWRSNQAAKSTNNGSPADSPSKARTRKTQLEFIGADCDRISPFATAFSSENQSDLMQKKLQQQQLLMAATDNQSLIGNLGLQPSLISDRELSHFTASNEVQFPAYGDQSTGKPKKRKAPKNKDVNSVKIFEANKPSRCSLIRMHYAFHSKWTSKLKRRHFERVQNVTPSRVVRPAGFSSSESSGVSDGSEIDEEAVGQQRKSPRFANSSQNRARLRIASILEQLNALRQDDAELTRRANECGLRLAPATSSELAPNGGQLSETIEKTTQLLTDAFDRHSKLQRSVKQNRNLSKKD